jgi:hypothetical protein
MQYTELHNYLHRIAYLVLVYIIKWSLRVYLHDCCSDHKFMEEIKRLKIETVTHIFPKFMRMQGDVFDSCMHSFFAHTDVGAGGATDSMVQSVRCIEPGYRDDRPRLPLTIGSSELPL